LMFQKRAVSLYSRFFHGIRLLGSKVVILKPSRNGVIAQFGRAHLLQG
jgi:hypothetical protein